MEEDIDSQGTQPQKKKWLVPVIIVMLLILAGVGYLEFTKKADDKDGGGILSQMTKSLNPTCKYNDPDLCKFINGWNDPENLTMNSTSTREGKITSTSVFLRERGDKYQITEFTNGKESYGFIADGSTYYTKDYTDNKWFRHTSRSPDDKKTDKLLSFYLFGELTERAESGADQTTYEKIGSEACGNLTCFNYKVIDQGNTDYTEYIYFDDKDYRLRKRKLEYRSEGVSEFNYDYSRVSIREPSPVKEGNPYEATMPTGSVTNPPPTQSTTPSESGNSAPTNTEYPPTETESWPGGDPEQIELSPPTE